MATIKHIDGWEWLLVGVVYNKRMHYRYIEPMKCQGAVPVKVMDISTAFGSENLHSHAYSLSYTVTIVNECTHSVNFLISACSNSSGHSDVPGFPYTPS